LAVKRAKESERGAIKSFFFWVLAWWSLIGAE
jgi:hypothetical protein